MTVRFAVHSLGVYSSADWLPHHITLVLLNYKSFRPDGRAFLVFPEATQAQEAVKKLNGALLSGASIRAFGPRPTLPLASMGNGPGAGVKDFGRIVHLEGLPPMHEGRLADALSGDRFTVEDTADSPGIRKITQCVRLSTSSFPFTFLTLQSGIQGKWS